MRSFLKWEYISIIASLSGANLKGERMKEGRQRCAVLENMVGPVLMGTLRMFYRVAVIYVFWGCLHSQSFQTLPRLMYGHERDQKITAFCLQAIIPMSPISIAGQFWLWPMKNSRYHWETPGFIRGYRVVVHLSDEFVLVNLFKKYFWFYVNALQEASTIMRY